MLQQNEQWAAAAEIYRSILEVAPDHADALHFSGVLAHQQARSDAGSRADRAEPRARARAGGLAQQSRDRPAGSTQAGRGDRRVPARDRARSGSRQRAQQSRRGPASAGQAGRSGSGVSRRHPHRTPSTRTPTHNLGVLLNGQKRPREAAVCFSKVITLRPKHPEARRLLALAHCTLGEVDKAVEVFEEWLRGGAGRSRSPGTCSRPAPAGTSRRGRRTHSSRRPSTASRPASTPSSPSSSYRAPALVARDAGALGCRARRRASTCSMPAVAPGCADRSSRRTRGAWWGSTCPQAMLAQARARSVYDELVKRELTAYLRDSAGAFDVIVSADTLVYFGPLDDVVAAAASALRPGGRLIFTVEELPATGPRRATAISPTRALPPCARIPRARAGGRESPAGDRPGGAAARSRRAGRGVGGASAQGRHAGFASLEIPRVSTRRTRPSLEIVSRCPPASAKARKRPSGDQAGVLSASVRRART